MMKRKAKIEVLMEDHEKVSIKIAAAQARISLSEYCHSMILKGKVISPFSSEELTLQRQLAGLANNLNQIAKVMNTKKEESNSKEALEVVRLLAQLLK